MSNYKNAEHFGYKVGDKFKYVPKALSINEKFNPNDVLTFVADDGSTCPRFENQNKVAGYEYLDRLESLKEIESKPLSYTDFVGKSLIVKESGYGFSKDDIGKICKIEAYSDNDHTGEKGFKVEGYDNFGWEFVGVKSFFPNGLTGELTGHILLESSESQGDLQNVTETVTTCPSTTIQEMLDACSCDNVSVQITVDSVIVYWNGMVLLVDNEVSIEQILKAITLLKKQRVNV